MLMWKLLSGEWNLKLVLLAVRQWCVRSAAWRVFVKKGKPVTKQG